MRLTHLIAAAAFGLLPLGVAQAMPVLAVPAVQADASPVILARAGCGFGAHRGPMGGCRLNHGPRGAMRGAMTGAPRGCPPGRYRVRGICRFR